MISLLNLSIIENSKSFINNQNLIDYLDKNDLELVFYPHFEIQRFLKDFHSVSPRVIIASFNDYDVQELLMNSKMLITDFSSVFFDFAYMGKTNSLLSI